MSSVQVKIKPKTGYPLTERTITVGMAGSDEDAEEAALRAMKLKREECEYVRVAKEPAQGAKRHGKSSPNDD